MSGIALAQARVESASECLTNIVLQQEPRSWPGLKPNKAEQEREAAARAGCTPSASGNFRRPTPTLCGLQHRNADAAGR